MTVAPETLRKILLVDDEGLVRNFVRISLEQYGYSVLDAGDGREALTLYKQHEETIGLLLTDVMMPEMSGPQLAGCLLEMRPDLPVLFISAVAEQIPSPMRRFHCVAKPFKIGELVRAVHELLRGGIPAHSSAVGS